MLQLLLFLISVDITLSWPDWKGDNVKWAEHCDFSENNLYNKPSTGEQCGGICESEPRCTNFVWTDYNGGTCWLKSGSNLPAIGYSAGYSVCGYIQGKSSGGGGGGRGAGGPTLHIKNNCPFDIWPGIQGRPLVAGGGFHLSPGQSRDVQVPDGWEAGRVWARRGCDGNLNCESGFCGNKLECGGNGGEPPVSLAEFTMHASGGQDFYDVSLVDGYNLPVSIEPVQGTYSSNGGPYDCKKAGECNQDLNQMAPEELKVYKNGHVAAVKSACERFHTDQYCCKNAHNTPQTCKSSDWPVDYPKIFKQACPTAYSYAYDDAKSTFTCRGSGGRKSPDYNIQFC